MGPERAPGSLLFGVWSGRRTGGASDEPAAGERHVGVAAVADDDVIVDRQVEDLARVDQLPGEPNVFRLGSGSPLGWLCTRISEATPMTRRAGPKTSRGWTSDADSVPVETS